MSEWRVFKRYKADPLAQQLWEVQSLEGTPQDAWVNVRAVCFSFDDATLISRAVNESKEVA